MVKYWWTVCAKCFVKYCDHRSLSHLDCIHLSPATTPDSTSAKTSSASQVLPKGPVVRVFLVGCCSIEPWVCPYDNNPPRPYFQAFIQATQYLYGYTIFSLGAVVRRCFNLLKLSWNFCVQLNFIPFFYNEVIRYAIFEKPSINLL